MTTFSDLGLKEPLLRTLVAEGYTVPTPIQIRAIPPLLRGRDLMGIAQTGTGKTAAFALPILQRLAEGRRRPAPRSTAVLVLTPTRELAVQIGQSFKTYGRDLRLGLAVVHGGIGQGPQVAALAGGPHVLIATPGRLLDLLRQRQVTLAGVETFVLDEADRMLDMGFIRDVRAIVAALPARRQTLMFSATMPATVAELADGILRDAERIEVAPSATTVELVAQRVLFVARNEKPLLLTEILKDRAVDRAIVFTRTKHGAKRVAKYLQQRGVSADDIHGNKSQSARQRTLAGFRAGRVHTLVATDIAARGIDVEGITHVINFDLPNEPESYVHRIGRTARAGAAGVALSLCDADELVHLKAIERTIRRPVAVDAGHAYHADAVARLRHLPVRSGRPLAGPRQHRKGAGRVAGARRPR